MNAGKCHGSFGTHRTQDSQRAEGRCAWRCHERGVDSSGIIRVGLGVGVGSEKEVG
jgi:hypothetical protein